MIIVSAFLVAVLAVAIKFSIEIDYGVEPITIEPCLISFHIMKQATDDEITSLIKNDKTSLNCDAENLTFVDLKTPLITALAYERYELVKEMLRLGAPVQKTIKILEFEEEDKFRADYKKTLLTKLRSLNNDIKKYKSPNNEAQVDSKGIRVLNNRGD